MKARAICDGRGNAGTGARAVVLFMEDGRVLEFAERLEPCTNIVAEHLAIQWAIDLALDRGVTDLLILNDSQTPVFHLQWKYKVKAAHLQSIVNRTMEQASRLATVEIQWVPREKTTLADKLCREVDQDGSTGFIVRS